MVPLAGAGLILGGLAGYFVHPAATAGRTIPWDASAGQGRVLAAWHLLSAATAQGAFLRAVLFAAAGLVLGLVIGWFLQRRPY